MENESDTFLPETANGREPKRQEKGAIYQTILPLIPKGATPITQILSVWRDQERWTYFMGAHPIYSHAHDDLRMFRLTAAQLIDTGTCRACEIIRTFGVSKSSIDRAVRRYRKGGAEAFFQPRRSSSHSGMVMNPDVIEQAQELLDAQASRRAIVDELEIPYTALSKAIGDGRLREPDPQQQPSSAKSERSTKDADAAEGMGTACTRPGERILAALGVLHGAETRFEPCYDVPYGGVLCALPALLSNGLLTGIQKCLGKLGGYTLCRRPYACLSWPQDKTATQVCFSAAPLPPGLNRLLGQ